MDWVGSGSGLRVDEFFVGFVSDLEVVIIFSGDYDDLNIDEYIKVFLGGDDIESLIVYLEKNEIIKKLFLVYLLLESLINEGEELFKMFLRKKLNVEFEDVESFSGFSFEMFFFEFGGDFYFGGEDDFGYEEKLEYGD